MTSLPPPAAARALPPVRMYTTAYCPFCVQAKQLLAARGVAVIDEIRIDERADERARMIERTGRRTVPQIFIGERHIGGCDDLVALDRRGELLPLLNGG